MTTPREVVTIEGPAIVGFFSPRSDEEVAADLGSSEGIAHLNFAISDTVDCLGSLAPTPHLRLARTLVLVVDGEPLSYKIASSGPKSVGAYLVAPGRSPRAVYATAGPSSLQVLLPDAAAEYFSEPRCKFES